MTMKILEPGLLTVIQDQGRTGYQKDGISVSGVMDSVTARILNILIGNDESEAVLEMTLKGAKITFQEDSLIALGGGDMAPIIDNEPVRSYRPVMVKADSVLTFRNIQEGFRTYLAVAGGFDVPIVMDSQSTYMRAGIGGLEGRALQKDDTLKSNTPSEKSKAILNKLRKSKGGFYEGNLETDLRMIPEISICTKVRAFRGRQYGWFAQSSCNAFFSETFTVTTESDRMGYRLDGPALEMEEKRELLSEAVTNGTIQVSADGKPIILLADRQTTGGYAKIAQMATVDLPNLAQLKPGSEVTFQEISHDEAQKLLISRENELKELIKSIDTKIQKEV